MASPKSDDPFGLSGGPGRVSSGNPFGASEPAAKPESDPSPLDVVDEPAPPPAVGEPGPLPFEEPARGKKGKSKKRKGGDEAAPAAAPLELSAAPAAPVARLHQESAFQPGRLIGIALALAVLAGGGYFMYTAANSGGSGKTRRSTEQPLINAAAYWSFTPPSKAWKPLDKTSPGVDLIVANAAKGGQIQVSTLVVNTPKPNVGREAARIQELWEKDFGPGFEWEKPEETTWMGRPALRVAAVGKGVRRESIITAGYGRLYRVTFEAPVDRYDALRDDFETARADFRFYNPLGDDTPPILDPAAAGDGRLVQSWRHPYQLQLPTSSWKEDPSARGLGFSMWADKLLSDKDAFVVVTPREIPAAEEGQSRDEIVKDRLEGMQFFFKRRLERRYGEENVKYSKEITTTIAGRPGTQMKVTIKNTDGDRLLVVSWVVGPDLIYQIECEAPAAKANVYEPQFAMVTGAFSLTEKPLGTKPEEKKPDPMAAPAAVAAVNPATMPGATAEPEVSGDNNIGTTYVTRAPGGIRRKLDEIDLPVGGAPAAVVSAAAVTIPKVDFARFFSDDEDISTGETMVLGGSGAAAGAPTVAANAKFPALDFSRFFSEDEDIATGGEFAMAAPPTPAAAAPAMTTAAAAPPPTPGGPLDLKVFDELGF